MARPASIARKRQLVLRAADARRAARAAVETGCEVEVVAPNGLRFLFRQPQAAPEPEKNPWDEAKA